jgi:hypothetical protein
MDEGEEVEIRVLLQHDANVDSDYIFMKNGTNALTFVSILLCYNL